MSSWTYVSGIIHVTPFGRTQAEERYILETVLDHLPIVSGSEGGMHVYIVQPDGHDCSSSHDEFGCRTNNLVDWYGCKSYEEGWLRRQSTYILVLDAKLRDRVFEETYRELQKFLCRLAKRVHVSKIMVNISGFSRNEIISNEKPYRDMFESTSWFDEDSYNWCEPLIRKDIPRCYKKD